MFIRHFAFLFTIVFLFLLPESMNVHKTRSNTVSQVKEEVVYTTQTGSKYHRSTCRYFSKSKIKTTKEKAIKAGNGACKVCKP